MNEKSYVNTDREIWRECGGDYYSPSVHVTNENKIGINVGGYVIVKSAEEWHDLARPQPAPPDTTDDIIANLIRRVHSLEQQLRDTQNNVERQGVEISANEHSIDELYGRMAHVEADVESNEEDIRTLDERTQTKVMLRSMTEFIERGLKERGVIR